MASLNRLTLFFTEPRQGWSESWYYQPATTRLKDQLDTFENLCLFRAALLGDGAKLIHMRVSQLYDNFPGGAKTPRVSLGRDKDISGPTGATKKLLATHDSVLLQCITADQAKKKFVFLGGALKVLQKDQNVFNPDATWMTAFGTWAAEVKRLQLGWLHQVKDQELTIKGYTISAATALCTYTLDAPLTFGAGEKEKRVNVNFPGGHAALDGIQLVGPVDAMPNNVITVKPRGSRAFNTVEGKMISYAYNFVSLATEGGNDSSLDPQRITKRARGKASYAEVGRRSAQVRG